MRNQKIWHRKKINGRNEIALPAIALNESRLNSPIKRQRDRKDWKTRANSAICAPLFSLVFCFATCGTWVSIFLTREVLWSRVPFPWLHQGNSRQWAGKTLSHGSFLFPLCPKSRKLFIIDIYVVLSGIVNVVYYSVLSGSRGSINRSHIMIRVILF